MIDKYIIQGQPVSGTTALEFLFLGANVFGATKSGAAIATDVRDFGKFVKMAGIPSLKGDNRGVANAKALIDAFKTSYGKSSDIFPKPDTTRINLAKGRTRFTPLRESGNPVSAGMQHVIEGHFNRPLSNSRSIFSISIDDLKGILQRKSVIASPISDLGNGQYRRMVDVGENIGNAALKYGGKPTSWIEIITDVKGNIITTYPVPKQ